MPGIFVVTCRLMRSLSRRTRLGWGVVFPARLVRSVLVVLIGWIVCFNGAVRAADQHAQHLVKGDSTTLRFDYVIGDAAITDPVICDFLVRDNRQEVYLNARAAGTVTLTLWDAEGVERDAIPVEVVATNLEELEATVRNSLSLPDGVKIARIGDKLRLEGSVTSEAILQKITSFAARTPNVESAVQLGYDALDDLARRMTAAIGRPGIVVRRVQDRIVMQGVAYSAESVRHAEEIARIYHPDIINLIEVRDTGRLPGKRPLVYLDVYFMEVKKSALRQFGIHWTPGGARSNGGGGIGGAIQATLGFVVDLLPKIRLSRQRGDAKVLEHGSLVVKSGEQGKYFSGQEVPYTSQQQVQFKQVGMSIDAEPIAAGSDVDLKIAIEVSALAAGVNGAIDRRNISTSAYCRSGQSMVLSGLWEHGRATTHNRLPQGIDASSALLALSLSKDFQSRQSDFLVFVTPRIATVADAAINARQAWDNAVSADKVKLKKSKRKTRSRAGRGNTHWSRRSLVGVKSKRRQSVPSSLTTDQSHAAPAGIIQVPPSLRRHGVAKPGSS